MEFSPGAGRVTSVNIEVLVTLLRPISHLFASEPLPLRNEVGDDIRTGPGPTVVCCAKIIHRFVISVPLWREQQQHAGGNAKRMPPTFERSKVIYIVFGGAMQEMNTSISWP